MLRWKSSLKPAAAVPSDDNPGTTNLVGDWSMDETSGTRADSHGSNDLTDNNTVGYATGVISNAASFTAANSESLSSSTQPVTGTNARATEVWFKTSSTADMCITSYGANGTGTWWRVRIENGVIWQRVAAGAISWSNTWNDGNWHHLVMQVAASSTLNDVVLYIDGTLQTHATSNTRIINTGSGDFYIGADSDGAFFDGDIDEVRYWDRVLTADEITWLYNSGSGKSYSDVSGGGSTGITLEDSATTTGAGYSTPVNIDVNIPAVSANDILLLLVATDSVSDITTSPPSGWTKITERDGTTVSQSTTAAYWKRASSGSTATTETWSSFVPDSGEVYYIWVGAYSGCVTSGSPVDAYGSSAIGYGTPWSVNVTTTTADTMIVTISGATRSDLTHTWSDGTELIDTVYLGNASVSINEKLEVTTGSKTRTVTPSITTSTAMIAVALKPADGGGTSPGTTNLLAWYEMNDACCGAVDSHSGSHDLTQNGTLLYAQTGVNGNAIDFDGSTGYFSLASTFGWSEAYPFSFSAFFKTSSASNQTISQITAPGAQGKYVLMNVQADGEVSAYVRAGTIQSITSSGAGVGDGAWHHLVATFVSATERYLYLDGVQVAGSASETSQAIDTAMSEIRVGADQSNGVSSYFDGLLEDVAFWSDELTLNEITWLYNGGSGRSYSAL